MSTIPLQQVGAVHFANDAHNFSVTTAHGDVTLRICKVIEHQAHELRAVPPCTVELSGPVGAPLSQGMYTIAHAVIGNHELFLVPIAQSALEIRYELIFN